MFIHLQFVDHHPEAVEWAPWGSCYGVAATMGGALLTVVPRDRRDLRGLYRGTTAMHGGMLPSLAPDFYPRERVAVVLLVGLLVLLGFAPAVLIGPADAFLSSVFSAIVPVFGGRP